MKIIRKPSPASIVRFLKRLLLGIVVLFIVRIAACFVFTEDYYTVYESDEAVIKMFRDNRKDFVELIDILESTDVTEELFKEFMEEGKNKFDLGSGVELEILDSYYYYNVAETENDHSVCAMINQGDRHFLFTGDLERKGEEKLVQMNDLPKVEVYKAGHHGSKTSSHNVLLEKIKPEIVCVCCCAGSSEYTKTVENQFPTQDFIDRIAPYTDKVYVTTLCLDYKENKFESMNGNIRVTSSVAGVTVSCSNNNTILRETAWFKQERTCPTAWK